LSGGEEKGGGILRSHEIEDRLGVSYQITSYYIEKFQHLPMRQRFSLKQKFKICAFDDSQEGQRAKETGACPYPYPQM